VDRLAHSTGAPAESAAATAPARYAGGPQAETPQGQAPLRLPSPANGLKIPVSLHQVQPEYTAEALKAHVEGEVELEGVVLSDGTVGNVRVTRSLDKASGLDAEAIRYARQWTFQPARDEHAGGRAVAMPVGLVVEFKINGQTAGPAGPRPFEDAFAQGAYSPDDPGIVGPKLVNHTTARYTVDALRAKIQGDVVVEAIVMPDGTVGKVRVVESIDPNGLDDEAIKAVKQWSFLPATLHGRPVSVLMTSAVSFRVH
jgi:TonB family protein